MLHSVLLHRQHLYRASSTFRTLQVDSCTLRVPIFITVLIMFDYMCNVLLFNQSVLHHILTFSLSHSTVWMPKTIDSWYPMSCYNGRSVGNRAGLFFRWTRYWSVGFPIQLSLNCHRYGLRNITCSTSNTVKIPSMQPIF